MEKKDRRICLDTDIIIDYLRGAKEIETLIEKLLYTFDEIVITAITVYELFAGVEYSGGKGRDKVEAVLKVCSIILPFDEKASRESSRISSELKKIGQQIGVEDEFIAAICKTSGACLLTKNVKHFHRIKGLKIFDLNEI